MNGRVNSRVDSGEVSGLQARSPTVLSTHGETVRSSLFLNTNAPRGPVSFALFSPGERVLLDISRCQINSFASHPSLPRSPVADRTSGERVVSTASSQPPRGTSEQRRAQKAPAPCDDRRVSPSAIADDRLDRTCHFLLRNVLVCVCRCIVVCLCERQLRFLALALANCILRRGCLVMAPGAMVRVHCLL